MARLRGNSMTRRDESSAKKVLKVKWVCKGMIMWVC